MNRRLLEEITRTLNAGARNYTVFLDFFEMELSNGEERDAIVKKALGVGATVAGIQRVEKASVWPSLVDALLYAGDDSVGPAATTVKSERLLTLLTVLEDEVRSVVDAASTIESFELQEGHPAYPVFWDFAFLFSGKASASILIGSSSD